MVPEEWMFLSLPSRPLPSRPLLSHPLCPLLIRNQRCLFGTFFVLLFTNNYSLHKLVQQKDACSAKRCILFLLLIISISKFMNCAKPFPNNRSIFCQCKIHFLLNVLPFQNLLLGLRRVHWIVLLLLLLSREPGHDTKVLTEDLPAIYAMRRRNSRDAKESSSVNQN